jgi:hypothetical protein
MKTVASPSTSSNGPFATQTGMAKNTTPRQRRGGDAGRTISSLDREYGGPRATQNGSGAKDIGLVRRRIQKA